MNKFWTLVFVALLFCFTSCTVTERIIINEDNSGEFYMSYDMAKVMSEMGNMFGEGADSKNLEEKTPGKVMDTIMVFKEMMETYKDSIADLPEEKQLAMEAVKDMYMKMHMDEDNGIFDFGIGMKFNSIDELKNIQDKIKKAQSLSGQGNQADAVKASTPIGKFMGSDNNGLSFSYTENGFSRLTTLVIPEETDIEELLFDENDDSDKKFMEYFENAYYNVNLTFPKRIKSTSIEDAEISEDGKTISYKTKWIDYIKDPKLLDVNIEFENE